MKKIEGYQCDKCLAIHDTQQLAQKCEDMHIIVSECTVEKVGQYWDSEGKYRIPMRVTLRFSPVECDVATYFIESIGCKN